MTRTPLLLTLLSAALGASTAGIPAPSNLSLSCRKPFRPKVSWLSHGAAPSCRHHVAFTTSPDAGVPPETAVLAESSWSDFVVMNTGFLLFTVKTVCGGEESETARINLTNPVLLTELRCLIFSSNNSSCSWRPNDLTRRLRFFFRLRDESSNQTQGERECEQYAPRRDGRDGCRLSMHTSHAIEMIFREDAAAAAAAAAPEDCAREGAWNSFEDVLVRVKPPALHLKVVESGGVLQLSWDPPELLPLDSWTFRLDYSECQENKSRQASVAKGQLPWEIPRVARCAYRFRIRAESSRGLTDWSEEVHVDAQVNYTLVCAAILPPLLLGALTVLLFACCRKNKDKIFPDIPKPRNLLSDIYDNKTNFCAPTKEEEFKISLVVEAQLTKPATSS